MDGRRRGGRRRDGLTQAKGMCVTTTDKTIARLRAERAISALFPDNRTDAEQRLVNDLGGLLLIGTWTESHYRKLELIAGDLTAVLQERKSK